MKYLTLEYIKAHSRIEYDGEDNLLTLYGDAAEETVMNICGTTYDKMNQEYTGIPKAVMQATLMLVDLSYQQRSPVSPTSMYAVPYTFDLLIKPYMKLTPQKED